MTKKKKGIIKMTPMKVHYYRSIISFSKYDNINPALVEIELYVLNPSRNLHIHHEVTD